MVGIFQLVEGGMRPTVSLEDDKLKRFETSFSRVRHVASVQLCQKDKSVWMK